LNVFKVDINRRWRVNNALMEYKFDVGACPHAPMTTPDSFPAFHDKLQAAALKATKASAGLPADLAFYKTVDEGLKENVDRLESRVLDLIGKCLALANGKGKGKEVRIDGDDIVDDFHNTVVDAVDILLEKTVGRSWFPCSGLLISHQDICLDEFSGKLKRPAAPPATETTTQTSSSQAKPYLPPSLRHASGLAKPQERFPVKVDNSDDVQPPHIRLLKHKYNARMPLGYALQKEDLVDEFTAGDGEVSIMCVPFILFFSTRLSHSRAGRRIRTTTRSPISRILPISLRSHPLQLPLPLFHLPSPTSPPPNSSAPSFPISRLRNASSSPSISSTTISAPTVASSVSCKSRHARATGSSTCLCRKFGRGWRSLTKCSRTPERSRCSMEQRVISSGCNRTLESTL